VRDSQQLATDDVGIGAALLRDQPSQGVVAIGAAGLAAAATAEDLVDERRQLVNSVILGGRNPLLRVAHQPLDLRLTDSQMFNSGIVYVAASARAELWRRTTRPLPSATTQPRGGPRISATGGDGVRIS